MYQYDYVTPRRPRVLGGEGVLARLSALVDEFGARRLLVITSPTFYKCAVFQDLLRSLGGRVVAKFAEVESHSPLQVVKRAAQVARDASCDAVISIGGGSVIDSGKGVVWYLDEEAETAPVRHIAVPSTLSGAEFTNTIGITHNGSKHLHVHDRIILDAVLLDPAVAAVMPINLLQGSLLNAMDHSLEGLMSIGRSPMTDATCVHAIRLMQRASRALGSASGLADAQTAGALSVMDTSILPVGLAHALAHVIGGRCRTPHGFTHGLVAAPVMRFNMAVVAPQQRLIAEALGADVGGLADMEAAWQAIVAVQDLVGRMGAPRGLRELGVSEADLPILAELVMEDRYSALNPRPVTPVEALDVLKWAWSGSVPKPQSH